MATVDNCQIESTDESSEERRLSLSQSLKEVSGERSVSNPKQSFCSHLRPNNQQMVCLRNKSAILILFWSFLAGLFHWFCTNPFSVIARFTKHNIELDIFIIGSIFIFYALLQLFYPVAGLLADVRYGRYRCVVGSLWSFAGGALVLYIVGFTVGYSPSYLKFSDHSWSYAILAVLLAVLAIPAIVGSFLFILSILVFNANVIQFGLDQLHDKPTQHLVLYIHWYVLLSFAGGQVATLMTSFCFLEIHHELSIVALTVLAYMLLILSLCVGYFKKHVWFLEDPGSRNPYRLVYQVICFAQRHTYPI